MKYIFLLSLFSSLSAFAEIPGAGKQIASCVVSSSYQHREDGNTLEVYQLNDVNNSMTVVMGKNGKKLLIPANKYQFSSDQSTLNIQFANFNSASITRGIDTAGTSSVMLGAPASTLVCTTNW